MIAKPGLKGKKTTPSLAIKKHASPSNSSSRFSVQISVHTEKVRKPVRNEQTNKTDINLVRWFFQRVTKTYLNKKSAIKKHTNPGEPSSLISAQLLIVHGEKVYKPIMQAGR
jgi:hypothetical protein